MGGSNESVLKSDKVNETVLPPDRPPQEKDASDIFPDGAYSGPKVLHGLFSKKEQYQTIRQHLNNGQIHFHVDAESLKVAIPVAEWFLIMKSLRSMTNYKFVDTTNSCTIDFEPFIDSGEFDVAIDLKPIRIGTRFSALENVTKR